MVLSWYITNQHQTTDYKEMTCAYPDFTILLPVCNQHQTTQHRYNDNVGVLQLQLAVAQSHMTNYTLKEQRLRISELSPHLGFTNNRSRSASADCMLKTKEKQHLATPYSQSRVEGDPGCLQVVRGRKVPVRSRTEAGLPLVNNKLQLHHKTNKTKNKKRRYLIWNWLLLFLNYLNQIYSVMWLH